MWRRLRWVLLALVVVVTGLVVAAVLTQKPTLDDDEHAVDARWSALRDSLAPRYVALENATTALGTAGEGDRTVTQDLTAGLAAWKQALDHGTATDQAEIANRLEGLGTRLRANIVQSARLNEDTALVAALAAYDGVAPAPDAVTAYNRAVRTYEDDRTDTIRSPVAMVFGFDARPRFDPRT
jgi:hypothetical protein